MYIHHLRIDGFGKWEKKDFIFNQSSFFIVGKNESGKSTLLKALIAAFYGLGTKSEKRKQHFSWNAEERNSACFVGVEFSYANKHYRLERKFGKTASGDRIKLLQLPLGKEIPLSKQEPGEYLFKLNRISFENLCYLGHQGAAFTLSEDKNKELLEKLKSLGHEGTENASLEKTKQNLQSFFETLLSKSKTKGHKILWEKRLEKIKILKQQVIDRSKKEETYLSEIKASKENVQKEEKLLQELNEQLNLISARLKKEEQNFTNQKEYKNLYEKQYQQILELTEHLKQRQQQLQQLEKQKQSQSLLKEKMQAEQILEEENLEKEIQKHTQSLENYNFALPIFQRSYTYLALTTLFAVSSILSFIFQFPIFLIPSILFALLTIALTWWTYQKEQNQKAMHQQILREISYLEQSLKEKKNTNQKLLEQQENRLNEIQVFLDQTEAEKELELHQLKDEHKILEELKIKINSVPITEQEFIELQQNKQKIELKTKNVQDAIHAEKLKQNSWHTHLEVLPQISFTLRELNQTETQILEILEDIQQHYQKLEILLSTLEKTKEFLSEQMSPNLLNKASHYLKHLTQGRYEKLLLGQDLNVQVLCQEDNSYHVLEVLSQGTIEIIYFALRLALLNFFEEQLHGHSEKNLHFPLFLDDTFVHLDGERISRAFECLQQEERQCFYLCKQALPETRSLNLNWATLTLD